MSDQMSFVFAKKTKHALAVISGVASPTAPLATSDLASPSLLLRDSSTGIGAADVRFYISPDQLDVFTGDVVDGAWVEPRGYSVDKDNKKVDAQPNLGSTLILAFGANSVDVDLPANASTDLDILVFYAGADPAKSEAAAGKIPVGTTHGHVPTGPLASNTHILVLVDKFTPRIEPVP